VEKVTEDIMAAILDYTAEEHLVDTKLKKDKSEQVFKPVSKDKPLKVKVKLEPKFRVEHT
jgi:hypothetical protein